MDAQSICAPEKKQYPINDREEHDERNLNHSRPKISNDIEENLSLKPEVSTETKRCELSKYLPRSYRSTVQHQRSSESPQPLTASTSCTGSKTSQSFHEVWLIVTSSSLPHTFQYRPCLTLPRNSICTTHLRKPDQRVDGVVWGEAAIDAPPWSAAAAQKSLLSA